MTETSTTQQPTRCGRCNRPLTSTRSTRAGFGPTCARKVRETLRAELLAQYSTRVASKAVELLETPGAIQRHRGRVYLVAGSTGSVYRTAPEGCTCPAGARGKHVCNHRVAVAVLLATMTLTRTTTTREPVALAA